jgi:hypothetical protein
MLAEMTQEELRRLLHYDPTTGVWTWRVSVSRKIRVGSVAGSIRPDGYKLIGINEKRYLSSRLAWLYMKGYFPDEVDHQSTNPGDDWWDNLREANRRQNNCNQGKRKDNTSGFKGVSFRKPTKKWKAQIQQNNKTHHLGYFSSPEEAHEAYKEAAASLHGDFARIE